jgi:hypothetical protein
MTTPLKVRIGAAVWCVFAYFSVSSLHDGRWAEAMLLLAALVLMPMAWSLVRDFEDTGWAARLWRFDLKVHFPAALLLLAAFLLPPGPGALLCALPWAVVLGIMAVDGILRIRRHGFAPLGLLCRDVGLVYASIGGAWLLADRAGWAPLGFAPEIVLLTAVHFHFAGLVLPVVAGLALNRRPQSRLAQGSTWLVLLGVPLVAVGITTVQLGGPVWVELVAAWVLVLGGLGVAWQHLVLTCVERTVCPAARGLWLVAGLSLAGGMVLAALYASRGYFAPLPWLDIPWMRALHGTLNALGFSLAALLGWCRAGRACCSGK